MNRCNSDTLVQPETVELYSTWFDLKGTQCCLECMNCRNSDTLVLPKTVHDELYACLRFDLGLTQCYQKHGNRRNSYTIVQPETIHNELDTWFGLRIECSLGFVKSSHWQEEC